MHRHSFFNPCYTVCISTLQCFDHHHGIYCRASSRFSASSLFYPCSVHCHIIVLVHCHGNVLMLVHTWADCVDHSWSCCCIVVAECLLLKLHVAVVVDGLHCKTRHPGGLELDQHAHEQLRRLTLPQRHLLLPRRCLLLPRRLLLPQQLRQFCRWKLRHLNVRIRSISRMLLVCRRW